MSLFAAARDSGRPETNLAQVLAEWRQSRRLCSLQVCYPGHFGDFETFLAGTLLSTESSFSADLPRNDAPHDDESDSESDDQV